MAFNAEQLAFHSKDINGKEIVTTVAITKADREVIPAGTRGTLFRKRRGYAFRYGEVRNNQTRRVCHSVPHYALQAVGW